MDEQAVLAHGHAGELAGVQLFEEGRHALEGDELELCTVRPAATSACSAAHQVSATAASQRLPLTTVSSPGRPAAAWR